MKSNAKHKQNQIKPPLGIMPKQVWESLRALDLIDAISRRRGNLIHPANHEWFIELAEILKKEYNS